MSASKSRAAALTCLTAVMLPLLVAPSLPGCGCTNIGCASGGVQSLDIADDLSLPAGSTITACFNDTCATAELPTSVLPGSGVGLGFPSGSGVSGTLWDPALDRDRVDVRYQLQDGTPVGAGDRYRLTVNAPSGEVIADKELVAVGYDKFEPNGSSCGPTCHYARFPEA
jgi:hypothetical protein